MYRLLILFASTAFLSAAAFAQDLSTQTSPSTQDAKMASSPQGDKLFRQLAFNGGFHTEFFNGVQSDGTGNLRLFDPAPVVGVTGVAPFKGFELLPEFNWVLPRKSGGNILKNLLMLRGDFGYFLKDWFRIRAGSSLMWLNQHGTGGQEKINNGNSTSNFYYPDQNRSSLNNTLDLGTEFLLGQWSVRAQTYIYSAFKEDRRQVSYSLFVSYYWDR